MSNKPKLIDIHKLFHNYLCLRYNWNDFLKFHLQEVTKTRKLNYNRGPELNINLPYSHSATHICKTAGVL
jgi:hypothetical protein